MKSKEKHYPVLTGILVLIVVLIAIFVLVQILPRLSYLVNSGWIPKGMRELPLIETVGVINGPDSGIMYNGKKYIYYGSLNVNMPSEQDELLKKYLKQGNNVAYYKYAGHYIYVTTLGGHGEDWLVFFHQENSFGNMNGENVDSLWKSEDVTVIPEDIISLLLEYENLKSVIEKGS